MDCPRCQSKNKVKTGFQGNKQRFKCKDCSRLFIENQEKAYPAEMRQKAIALYLEGLGFRAIGRFLGVSNVTVLNWVRQAAKALPSPEKAAKVEILELDEMWHFVKKRVKNSGSGWLLSVSPIGSLTSNSVAVVFPA